MTGVPPESDDWLESEPRLTKMVIADLQRLKYRAKARIIQILVLATLLTAAVSYKLGKRPEHHLAHVTLAIQEGEAAERDSWLPINDLRGYVTTVLMPDEQLLALIEKYHLSPLRKSQGDTYALNELWDMLTVEVYRNYFLYDFDESAGEGRSARIAITVDHPDPDTAFEVARDLGTIIVNAAAADRDATARKISTGARLAGDAARRRVLEIENELLKLNTGRAEAVAGGFTAQVTGFDVEIAAILGSLKSAHEAQNTIAQRTGTEELRAAVYAAGLSLDVSIVEERKPDTRAPGMYRIAMFTAVLFIASVLVIALYISAFDPRVHDLDDVSRLGIPVVGQVPGFPGDRVGSLRDRGVTRRGVPWSWR